MSQAVVVKVKVSNDEQNYTKKFLCYETLTLNREDPLLVEMVEGTVKDFKGPAEDVNITFSMVW